MAVTEVVTTKQVRCPDCRKWAAGKLAYPSSLSSLVDYFRCRACGYVWCARRERRDARTASSGDVGL